MLANFIIILTTNEQILVLNVLSKDIKIYENSKRFKKINSSKNIFFALECNGKMVHIVKFGIY